MSTIAESVTVNRVRLESIDIVRGVILVLMARDQVRDFFGVPGVSPTDLDPATKALFSRAGSLISARPVFFVLTALAPICRYAENPNASYRDFCSLAACG
jgi:uncharacterized membrane protein